jgi:hypothetical protein
VKILKRIMKPIQTVNAPSERFSFRVQDGVEIYEHEALFTCEIPKSAASPRLIIAEPDRAQSSVILKARDEISGLTAFLRSLTAARLKS